MKILLTHCGALFLVILDPREARLKAVMEKLQRKGCSMGVVHCTASQATPPEWVSGAVCVR